MHLRENFVARVILAMLKPEVRLQVDAFTSQPRRGEVWADFAPGRTRYRLTARDAEAVVSEPLLAKWSGANWTAGCLPLSMGVEAFANLSLFKKGHVRVLNLYGLGICHRAGPGGSG